MKVLQFFRLPILNESESNLKPIRNKKRQSETKLKVKVNPTQSETELEGQINWGKSETELKGAFHCGRLYLRFHPLGLLLDGTPLGLDLPPSIDYHCFFPGLPFSTNPNGLLQNPYLLLHNAPLNLRLSFRLRPHRPNSCRFCCARTVLSF